MMPENCDLCGRFISWKALAPGGGAGFVIVPGSDMSYEERAFRCPECTKKHGSPQPRQCVRLDRCCGVA